MVGVDATPRQLEAVEEGTLKGTVQSDAAGQARDIVSLACTFLAGEDPAETVGLEDEKYVWLSYSTVTR